MAFSARMKLLAQATIADPATISLADVGEYFTSDNVEAALQETGSQLAQKENLLTTLAGFDAIATQTLKNISGVLTWVDDL